MLVRCEHFHLSESTAWRSTIVACDQVTHSLQLRLP